MEEIPRSMEVPEIEKHPERIVVTTCLRAGSNFDPVVIRPMPLCRSQLAAYTLLGYLCSLGKLPLRPGAIRKSETSEGPNLNSLVCSSGIRKNSVG